MTDPSRQGSGPSPAQNDVNSPSAAPIPLTSSGGPGWRLRILASVVPFVLGILVTLAVQHGPDLYLRWRTSCSLFVCFDTGHRLREGDRVFLESQEAGVVAGFRFVGIDSPAAEYQPSLVGQEIVELRLFREVVLNRNYTVQITRLDRAQRIVLIHAGASEGAASSDPETYYLWDANAGRTREKPLDGLDEPR